MLAISGGILLAITVLLLLRPLLMLAISAAVLVVGAVCLLLVVSDWPQSAWVFPVGIGLVFALRWQRLRVEAARRGRTVQQERACRAEMARLVRVATRERRGWPPLAIDLPPEPAPP